MIPPEKLPFSYLEKLIVECSEKIPVKRTRPGILSCGREGPFYCLGKFGTVEVHDPYARFVPSPPSGVEIISPAVFIEKLRESGQSVDECIRVLEKWRDTPSVYETGEAQPLPEGYFVDSDC